MQVLPLSQPEEQGEQSQGSKEREETKKKTSVSELSDMPPPSSKSRHRLLEPSCP